MSTQFLDRHIEVVKLTLKSKSGGSSVSYSFSQDYFDAGQLYTTNPIIYPLLVRSPVVKRGVGIHYGIKYDVSIELYGKTELDRRNFTLADLVAQYETHDAEVEIRYYPKADSGLTTDSDANNLRQKLKVISSYVEESSGNLALECRDVFFKDKEVSKRLTSEKFPNMQIAYDGEYGPIVFGQNSIIADGVPFDSLILSDGVKEWPVKAADYRFVDLFSGWTFTNHPNKEFRRLLVENVNKLQDDRDWLQVELPSDASLPFLGNSNGFTLNNFPTAARSAKYSPTGNADLMVSLSARLAAVGVRPDATDGLISFSVFHAEYKSTTDTWQPIGASIGTGTVDPKDLAISGAWTDLGVYFETPVVLSPFCNYLFVFDFSNATDTTNTVAIATETATGVTSYKRLKNETERGWEKVANTAINFEANALGYGPDAWISGSDGYSYLPLVGDSFVGSSSTFLQNLNYKLGIDGLADDGSGTYTGSANAIIENPADIAYFALKNSEFGVGLSSGELDATSFSTARSLLASLGITFKIVIDQFTTAEDFLAELSRQSRTCLFKDRRGRMALNYWQYHNNVFTVFAETYHRGDLFLLQVRDNDYSTVVNDFENFYSPDEFNQPKDIAKLRKVERMKLQGALVLNDTQSTARDTARKNTCAASVTRYGRREMTQRLQYYDTAEKAQIMQNYWCDRYSSLQRQVKFKIPRKNFYTTLDLFSNVQVQHSAIECAQGTDLNPYGHNSNNDVTEQTSGLVPVQSWIGGTVSGQVVEVEEEGYWMTLTAETMGVF